MPNDDDERKAFAGKLAKIREAAGYTLRSAADALTERGHKIGFAAIGAWEAGRNLPDALWLRRLARLYNVPTDAMFSGPIGALFSRDLLVKIHALDAAALLQLENVMRAHLGMPAQEVSAEAKQAQQEASRTDEVQEDKYPALSPEQTAALRRKAQRHAPGADRAEIESSKSNVLQGKRRGGRS